MCFPPIFKYHVVFQHQPEDDYIGKDDIMDMTEVIAIMFTSLQYVILCSKSFITVNGLVVSVLDSKSRGFKVHSDFPPS